MDMDFIRLGVRRGISLICYFFSFKLFPFYRLRIMLGLYDTNSCKRSTPPTGTLSPL